ncbi:MAG: trigger factor [Gammaproteobacteria bacterium]|nr:trigger factor [Gammaproteobacteria bacterium]
MQISVETTGSIGRRMTVSVPADEFEREISTRLTRLTRNLKLPGFRPGKVPLRLVEARYGGQVVQEAAGELIQSSYRDALGQQGLTPAGGPAIEPTALERGKDLEYVATFDVFPEIPCTDIKGKRLEKPQVEIADDDIERTIDSVRRQRATWEPVERAVRNEDRVVIDFVGTIDGEPFEGGKADGYTAVVGSGALLEDFDKSLVGAEVDGQRNVEVTFPDDYANEAVAGKTAVFEITVREVAEPRLPEVDAEFAKAFGIEDGSLDSLRDEVRENLQRELKDRMRRYLHDEVMRLLQEANEFDLPQQMVDEETERMAGEIRALRGARNAASQSDVDKTALEPEARRRVALGLILREVIRVNALTADAARVKARLEEMASSYENPEAFLQWYHSDQGRMMQVQSAVLEDQVVERLLEDADVVDKPMAFAQFVNRGAVPGAEDAPETEASQ